MIVALTKTVALAKIVGLWKSFLSLLRILGLEMTKGLLEIIDKAWHNCSHA